MGNAKALILGILVLVFIVGCAESSSAAPISQEELSASCH
jgi:outer membrane lipoprotein-sorting protein